MRSKTRSITDFMIQIFPRALSLLLLTLSMAVAQDAAPEEKREEKGRQARFVCSSVPEGLENPVRVLSGTEVTPVVISKYSASDAVKIPADGIIRIVREIANPQDPQKPQYLTLAQATIPETINEAVIILVPMAKSANGMIFHTKVQDVGAFKGGETMFLNLTNTKIGIELGTAKIALDSGQVKTHNPLGTSASVSLPIRLSFLDTTKNEWAMITASTVALYATRRELCMFIWDTRFNRVDFESVTLPAAKVQ